MLCSKKILFSKLAISPNFKMFFGLNFCGCCEIIPCYTHATTILLDFHKNPLFPDLKTKFFLHVFLKSYYFICILGQICSNLVRNLGNASFWSWSWILLCWVLKESFRKVSYRFFKECTTICFDHFQVIDLNSLYDFKSNQSRMVSSEFQHNFNFFPCKNWKL